MSDVRHTTTKVPETKVFIKGETLREIDKITSEYHQQGRKLVPTYNKVVKACDAYEKALLQLVQANKLLAQEISDFANTSPMEDMKKIVLTVSSTFDQMGKDIEQQQKDFNEITVSFRKDCGDIGRDIDSFKSTLDQEKKQANESCLRAEKIAKQNKDANKIKDNLQNIAIQERKKQDVTVKGLKDIVFLVRSVYLQMTEQFADYFSQFPWWKETDEMVKRTIPMWQKAQQSKDHLPRNVKELVTEKKQSFIDTRMMSDEMKDILKAANIKPKDLSRKETADMIISIVEDQVRKRLLPISVLHMFKPDAVVEFTVPEFSPSSDDVQIGDPADAGERSDARDEEIVQVVETVETQDEETQTVPGKKVLKRPPPGKLKKGTKRTGPGTTSSPDVESSVPAPPPPPMNITPVSATRPAATAVPVAQPVLRPVEPKPVANNPAKSGGLLDQIQRGTKLKNAADRKLADKELSDTQANDLTNLLATAMASRRKDLKKSEDTDSSDSWDDED